MKTETQKETAPCYFQSSEACKVGDLIATGRYGQCRVLSITPDCEVEVRNIHTAEVFHSLACDCDLIERAKQDPAPTKVIFRTFRDKSRETVAVFPEIPSDRNGYCCTLYAHAGQHGGGDRHGLISGTRPATSDESAPLRRELESIGYSIQECRKITHLMDRTRMESARSVH